MTRLGNARSNNVQAAHAKALRWISSLDCAAGHYIAAGAKFDGSITVWDRRDGATVYQYEDKRVRPWRSFAMGELAGEPVLIYSVDSSIYAKKLMDSANEPTVLMRYANDIYTLAVSSDQGDILAFASGSAVVVYDLIARRTMLEYELPAGASAQAIAISASDSLLAIGAGSRIVVVNLTTTVEVCDELVPRLGPIHALTLRRISDETVLVSAGGEYGAIAVLDANTGVEATVLDSPFSEYVRSVELGILDEQPVLLAAGGDRSMAAVDSSIKLWNLKTGRRMETGYLHQGRVVYANDVFLEHSADTSYVISAGEDGRIRRWDLADSVLVGVLPFAMSVPVKALATTIREARPTIVSGGEDFLVRQWDAWTLDELSPAITASGRTIDASAGITRGTNVVATASQDIALVQLWDSSTGREIGAFGSIGPVLSVQVCWWKDTACVAEGHGDGTIVLWDTLTSTKIKELRLASDPIISLAYSTDSQDRVLFATDGRLLRGWNTQTEEMRYQPIVPDSVELTCIESMTMDGRPFLIAGTTFGQVLIWDVTVSDGIRTTVKAHAGATMCLRSGMRNLSRYFVSGGADGKVRLWDAGDGHPVSQAKRCHDGAVNDAVFTPLNENLILVSGGQDGKLVVTRLAQNGEVVAEEASVQQVSQFVASSTDARHTPDHTVPELGGLTVGAKRVPSRPRVFVGSSAEGLSVAKALQRAFDHAFQTTIWNQGIFGPGGLGLSSLLDATRQFDFAVFVVDQADTLVTRAELKNVARDNVIFELGLFLGSLGPDRCFVVFDRTRPPDLPSDLNGLNAATYQMHDDGNLDSSLGAASSQIEERIRTVVAKAE